MDLITSPHPSAAKARLIIRGLALLRAALAPGDPLRQVCARRIALLLTCWRLA